MEPITLQPVTVADGSEQQCQYVCRVFKWMLQVAGFCADVFFIPLGSYDVILGHIMAEYLRDYLAIC